jgi:nucleotide-binding universal stress UspA family protein
MLNSTHDWRTAMPRRILIAYDGSEASYRALAQAVEVAQAEEAEVGVVTVLRPERSAADEAAAYLLERGFEPEVYTPVGDPASEISRVADEEGFDTIYVGTRGRGSLLRALEGSVSRAVAEGAEVTVVIAR